MVRAILTFWSIHQRLQLVYDPASKSARTIHAPGGDAGIDRADLDERHCTLSIAGWNRAQSARGLEGGMLERLPIPDWKISTVGVWSMKNHFFNVRLDQLPAGISVSH